jgi:hypothetical protein
MILGVSSPVDEAVVFPEVVEADRVVELLERPGDMWDKSADVGTRTL